MSESALAQLAPRPDRWSRPYWEAAADGRLLLQRCGECGRHQHYPRGHCVACGAGDPDWVGASGRGVLETFTTIALGADAWHAERTPFVLAVARLAEGPRLLARLHDAPGRAACGAGVTVGFEAHPGGWTLPVFELIDEQRLLD